jgi:hypothetical protein
MTAAMTRFQKQLKAIGRERLDGFDAAIFDAMTLGERQSCFRELSKKFESDPGEELVTAMWLSHADSAVEYFKKNNLEDLSPSVRVRAYIRLWQKTHDDAYLNETKDAIYNAVNLSRNSDFGYFDLLTILVDIDEAQISSHFCSIIQDMIDQPINDIVTNKAQLLLERVDKMALRN